MKEERCLAVTLQLNRLSADIARVEREPSLVRALQQHHAHRWPRGRERHRFGCLHGLPSVLVPGPELLQRIVAEVSSVQLRAQRNRSRSSGITRSRALPLPTTRKPRTPAAGMPSTLPSTSSAALAISSAVAIIVACSSYPVGSRFPRR